jgi:hypothetical protein
MHAYPLTVIFIRPWHANCFVEMFQVSTLKRKVIANVVTQFVCAICECCLLYSNEFIFQVQYSFKTVGDKINSDQ